MALTGNQQKILSKVMKLLQMTVENGCTEAEANSAKEKAETLLREYNMSHQDLDLADMVIDKFYPADENNVGYAKAPQWVKTVLGGVNRAFGCVVVWGRDDDGDIIAHQSGRSSDMEVADYCYIVIRDQIFDLTREYIKTNNLRKNSSQVASFQESLAYTVVVNLQAVLGNTHSGQTGSNGKSLTIIESSLVRVDEARDYISKEMGIDIVQRSSSLRQNQDGVSAASRVSVSKAMGGGTSTARLTR
jgi:hypothetical protein